VSNKTEPRRACLRIPTGVVAAEVTRRISCPKCFAVRLVTSAATIFLGLSGVWASDERRGQPTTLAGRLARPDGAFKHPTDRVCKGRQPALFFPNYQWNAGFQR
jgi:hypothetical protein